MMAQYARMVQATKLIDMFCEIAGRDQLSLIGAFEILQVVLAIRVRGIGIQVCAEANQCENGPDQVIVAVITHAAPVDALHLPETWTVCVT